MRAAGIPAIAQSRKGLSTFVEPIKDVAAIETLKAKLRPSPRDYCLFTLGINTAYRANELLSITCGQVRGLKAGDAFNLYQSKVKKRRSVQLNNSAADALQFWLTQHPAPHPNAPLFLSRSGSALQVKTVSTRVKRWCREIDLYGNYASHTLRKTWGYHVFRQRHDIPAHMVLTFLMVAYGHQSPMQTLDYICVQPHEVSGLFMSVEL